MRGRAISSRTIALSLVFAAAGGCFALATSQPDGDGSGAFAASRGVGSTLPLRFTNPHVLINGVDTGEYDLGDVCGSATITRYVTADGGLRPYRFTSQGTQNLAAAVGATDSTLKLGLSGAITGRFAGQIPLVGAQLQGVSSYRTAALNVTAQTVAASPVITNVSSTSGFSVGAPVSGLGIQPGSTIVSFTANTVTLNLAATQTNKGPLFVGGGAPGFRFLVSVQDAKGTAGDTISGFFNLFFTNCKTFRFAFDQLPLGRLASTYMTKIDTVGGSGPVAFTVTSVSGAASSQEQAGIFISSDGTVFGKPLVIGTLTYVVHAVDSKGAVALNRAATAPDQTFTLTVSDNPITSSDVVTTRCSISGDSSKQSKDHLTYSGLLNVLGQDTFAIQDSAFSFHAGGIAVSGTFNRQGRFAATLADTSRVSVRVNLAAGTYTVSISSGTFGGVLNAKNFKNGVNTRLAIGTVVGDAVAATEVLDFKTRLSGTRYSLSYNLSSQGSNAGGAFQIIHTRGVDTISATGIAADAWSVAFIAMPRMGVAAPAGSSQGTNNVSSATVRIGSGFSQKLTPTNTNANSFSFHGVAGISTVRRLTLSAKSFKGSLVTAGITPVLTGIGLAKNAPRFGNIFFPLGLDLTRTGVTFSGEHARRVFGLRNAYSDLPPR